MRAIAFCFALFLAFAAAGSSRAETPSAFGSQNSAIDENARVAFIGDSHGEALGPRLARLAKKPSNFIFRKHRGSKAADWMKHPDWMKPIDEFGANAVIIGIGTNEATTRLSVDELAASFQKLADRASDGGRRKVYWIMPPYLEGLKNLTNVWDAIRRVHGIVPLDFSGKSYRSYDGKHLFSSAYTIWAQDIANLL